VLELLRRWCADPSPDRVIVLDVEPARALERSGGGADRFEGRGLAFQERVAEGYRRYAALAPDVVLIEGEGSREEVAARVLAEALR